MPLREIAGLSKLTSAIQDTKRDAIRGKSSHWPDHVEVEFAQLEARAAENPYVALDLDYLRDRRPDNRTFGYVISYATFVAPPRDRSGHPVGTPEYVAVVKVGDGGRTDGRSAGSASGSIISRVCWSYWDEANHYDPVLLGAVVPGADSGISRLIAPELGG